MTATAITDLTPDERAERLRLLADDYLDLHDVIQPLVWDGFVNAAQRLADWQTALDGSLTVRFEDLCDALRAAQRAANDPAAYAASLGWLAREGWLDSAEQWAQAQVDCAIDALVRPRSDAGGVVSEPVAFTWNGEPTGTIGELFDACRDAWKRGLAADFMASYRLSNEHADDNIGYLIGYVGDPAERASMYEAFGVRHPLIGGRP